MRERPSPSSFVAAYVAVAVAAAAAEAAAETGRGFIRTAGGGESTI